MYKIVINVRNRLAITKKCLESINKHSVFPREIYVYDNLTNYRLDEHFDFFRELYQKNIIHQYTVNSDKSTFNAFSKVVALNQFGYNHNMDPNRNKYDFLLFLDNDMIVTPGWDTFITDAWNQIKNNRLNNIKIVTQYPGGLKNATTTKYKVKNENVFSGKLGGSGFWAVNTNFFNTVGFLDCKYFIGKNKKHDQMYWSKLNRSSSNHDYIWAIQAKMAIHTGGIAGSVCNALTRNRNKKEGLEKVKFKEIDSKIDQLTFDQFYNGIKEKNILYKW